MILISSSHEKVVLMDAFQKSARRLLTDTQPLSRLAGRAALINPHDLSVQRVGMQRRVTGRTTWQNPDNADRVDGLDRVTRHIVAGKKPGDLKMCFEISGLYQGAFVELRLLHSGGSPTRFEQKADTIAYTNPLPTLAAEVGALNSFMDRIRSGSLAPIPETSLS